MMAHDAPRSLLFVRIKVAATILFHSSSAIAVTLISKSALNGIEAPISLLFLQTFMQVLLMTIIGKSAGWIQFSRPAAAWNAVIPLMLARLVGILAKTFCLVSVDASLYQLARGLLLPFTLVLSHFLLTPRPYNSKESLAGCGIIMIGFAFGMITDITSMLTSMTGLFLGIISSLTTSIEVVVVKRFLSKDDEGMWQMVWMTNCMSIVCYMPLLFASGELSNFSIMYHAVGGEAVQQIKTFLLTAMMTGGASFLLTMAAFLQVAVTSPTTHMIVTAARGVVQSGLAIVLLNESVTTGRVLGMACILGGSAVYGWGKDKDLHKKTLLRDEEKADHIQYDALSDYDEQEDEKHRLLIRSRSLSS